VPAVLVSTDQIRLSESIVIALAREGRLGDDSPVRSARTQAGLASALSSNQSAVSKVLRRLVAAELLTEQRRHVQGRSQRLKVYALTRRGELLAREVARRRNLSLLPERAGEGKESSALANL
jgi:DNA-binding MarR family transcriptional regulator